MYDNPFLPIMPIIIADIATLAETVDLSTVSASVVDSVNYK